MDEDGSSESDSFSSSEEDDGFGVKSPSLTRHIRGILRRYPDGGQILKELIQNADDAGASSVGFLVDSRTHGKEDVMWEGMELFQGPALYVWNDAEFQPGDWKFLAKIDNSSKEKEPIKVGRFGLGFISVFHITDLPMVVSGNSVGIIDPHRRVIPPTRRDQAAGKKVLLKDFLACKDHAACFNGVFKLSSQLAHYPGTLFRFPLRQSHSNISSSSYNVKKVKDNLFKSFQVEAHVMLLFLKNITSISLYEWNTSTNQPERLYCIEVKPDLLEPLKSERAAIQKAAISYATSRSSVKVMVYSTSFISHGQEDISKSWLIVNMVGSSDYDVQKLSQKLKVIPWVGVAIPLPVELRGCSVQSYGTRFDFPAFINQLTRKLERSCITLPVAEQPCRAIKGQVFCFLPIPATMSLPVNIHGYFAVGDNRRSIKWPGHDERSAEALWNEQLLRKMVVPTYAMLLVCRCTVVKYNPVTSTQYAENTDVTSDAYSAWPVLADVRNEKIWANLPVATLELASQFPLLWTAAHGGKWVKIREAYFLPGSFGSRKPKCPTALVQLLINDGHSVVNLPKCLCMTIASCSVKHGCEISPEFVRKVLRGLSPSLSVVNHHNFEEILDYILHDIDKGNCTDLHGIRLLPLMSSQLTTFESRSRTGKMIYIFPQEFKSTFKFLSGLDSCTVDPTLSHEISQKLHFIAESNRLQLKTVTKDVICNELLPMSLRSWIHKDLFGSVRWTPGVHNHPPREWIQHLWKWMISNVELSEIDEMELPIIPQEMQQQPIVLLPLAKSMHLCFLPLKTGHKLDNILKILNCKLISSNSVVHRHPDIGDYITEVTAQFIVKCIRDSKFIGLITGKFTKEDKIALRDFLSGTYGKRLSWHLPSAEASVICKLPIFEVGVGKAPKRFTSLDTSPQPALPSTHLNFPANLEFPHNILSVDSPYVVQMIKNLGIHCLDFEDLCIDYIVPFAMHSKSGDKLMKWVLLNMNEHEKLKHHLRTLSFIPTAAHVPKKKKPCELYDPSDKKFDPFFDSKCISAFPSSVYCDRVFLTKLRELGLKTWLSLEINEDEMRTFLTDRAKSTAESKSPAERSKYILNCLCKREHYTRSVVLQVPFLPYQQTPPSDIAIPNLWFGKGNKLLYKATDICLPWSNIAKIIGTVKPVLSSSLTPEKMKILSDHFYKPTPIDVVMQLENLIQSGPYQNSEAVKSMITSIYSYLSKYPTKLPNNWIWWKNNFVSSNVVVLESPFDLEPFCHVVAMNEDLKQFKPLFESAQVKKENTPEDLNSILHRISSTLKHKPLSESQLTMTLNILNTIYEVPQLILSQSLLIPTRDYQLLPPEQCTFPDRDWEQGIMPEASTRFKFVHQKLPLNQATLFGVKLLSQRVAPSKGLVLTYTEAGQHESVTHRIAHIVQDYGTSIDIPKELIQNADDAGATEVNFVFDWRSHPTDTLLTNELSLWQGPAMIVHNNAVFSDDDFEHICKLAGETKLNNPLKIGRFGVGFCASYHLTDVPSFISRRYFTVFDPHLLYLGSRVSVQNPGMRIDLVENQKDLKIYKDQFHPYLDLFDCNVFELDPEGYPATLFRFPFRNTKTARRSEISHEIYGEKEVKKLIDSISKIATELLLFLKHVNNINVYERKTGGSMKNVLSIARTTQDSLRRIEMISNYEASLPNSPHKSDSSFWSCDIEVVQDGRCVNTNHWLMCSVVDDSTSRGISSQSETSSSGLIPLAEIAMQTTQDASGREFLWPNLLAKGIIYCFLPLPIETCLPFHINGFFDVGKDRRNLTSTDDDAFGPKWNKVLASDALAEAFLCLFEMFASGASFINSDTKAKFLRQYYDLWPSMATYRGRGLVPEVFVSALHSKLPNTKKKVLWSEMGNGCWLSPLDAKIFDAGYSINADIENNAIDLMLHNGYPVVKVPSHVQTQLRDSLEARNSVFTYKQFCEKVLFPNIEQVDDTSRDCHLLFLLTKLADDNILFQWARDLIKQCNCIPCECGMKLIQPCRLIDPTKPHLCRMYSPADGRFPARFLRESTKAMKALKSLGMVTKELALEDLADRAEEVVSTVKDDPKLAKQRAMCVLQYVCHVSQKMYSHFGPYNYSRQSIDSINEGIVSVLKKIPFLPVLEKPDDFFLPWAQTEQFVVPSRAHHPASRRVVFTQKPIADVTEDVECILRFLGVIVDPEADTVVHHLMCISDHMHSSSEQLVKASAKYLDDNKVMTAIYHHLQKKVKEKGGGIIKENLAGKKCIWQEGHFLCSEQVLVDWTHGKYPYLCELSPNYKDMQDFFIHSLGVVEKPSFEMLANVLKNIFLDHHPEKPVSEVLLSFTEYVLLKLDFLFNKDDGPHPEVFLPDDQRIMRPASRLACDNLKADWLKKLSNFSQFETGISFFIHENIPRARALKLGARPILEALLDDIEDKAFLEGSDFGQHEDLCDRLNSILKKYPADTSIFKEFIQNADDAKASEVVIVLDNRHDFPDKKLFCHEEKWKKLQKTPALCIINNRKFLKEDIDGISHLGWGGKEFTPDTIGKFGIGFNVSYHLTDCPSFVSYDHGGVPEYFCVFDPTCSYVHQASKRSPGRKWDLKTKVVDDFPDQFEPYLSNKMDALREAVPNSLQDFTKLGYVVFRLPLVPQKVLQGHCHEPHQVRMCLQQLGNEAEDMLLFLRHVKQISFFEIKEDGKTFHHFTVNAESVLQAETSVEEPQHHFQLYQNAIHYIQNEKRKQTKKWLIQKAFGSKDSHPHMQVAQREGLKLEVGIAAPVGHTRKKYLLFCFLPTPIKSMLPVHINGHFFLDDSRKHLEKSSHHETTEWNQFFTTHLLVPCYVQLILNAKELAISDANLIGWFYGLFPDINHSECGEAGNLKIARAVYSELLFRNPSILRSSHDTSQWLKITGTHEGLFFVPSKFPSSTDDDKLRECLVSLKMQIVDAPMKIYKNFCVVDNEYQENTKVSAQDVVAHLRSINLSKGSCHYETVIQYNKELLVYLFRDVQHKKLRKILHSLPILLTMDNSLKRAPVYMTKFSILLPNHKHLFIHPDLEKTAVTLLVDVVINVPPDVIAENIQLLSTTVPLQIPSNDVEGIKLITHLWEYLLYMMGVLHASPFEFFADKAIIPTNDGMLYPVCLAKNVLCHQADENNEQNEVVHNVMTKLGYPTVDFSKLFPHLPDNPLQNCKMLNYCSGTDLVHCFKLGSPTECDIQLSPSEVQYFISCISGVKKLLAVSHVLKKLPLFLSLDQSTYISIGNADSVHILPFGIPLDGLSNIEKATNQVMLVIPDECTKRFYEKIFDNFQSLQSYVITFYLTIVLPKISVMNEVDILVHVKYIINANLEEVIEKLKKTPFVKLDCDNSLYLPSDVCDPEVEFFSVSCPFNLPSEVWRSAENLKILKKLAMKTQTHISESEWLVQARNFAEDTSIARCQKLLLKKSTVLLKTLMSLVSPATENQRPFLHEVSAIPFILSETSNQLMTFKGSVFHFNASLAYLCRHVLPSHFKCDADLHSVYEQLQIEYPLQTKTVVQNLLCLSQKAKKLCEDATVSKLQAVDELKHSFYVHYDFFENKSVKEVDIENLKGERCFIITVSDYSQVVTARQLAFHIDHDLEPFCYPLPTELNKYHKFLKLMGVHEKLKAKDYAEILCIIHDEQDREGEDSLHAQVAETVYEKLIQHAREEENLLPNQKLYLLSEDNKVMKSQDLVYNDYPYYSQRLEGRHTFTYKFLKIPPAGKDGMRHPPTSLAVKYLTEIISEKIGDDITSEDNTCLDELLFLQQRRNHRCQFVQKLQQTLHSEQFVKGLHRLYWHEHKSPPCDDFNACIASLKLIEFKCVLKLTTVLCEGGNIINGTEDSHSLCHLNAMGDNIIIYICPHSKPEHSFIKDFTREINRILKNYVRNEYHISVMFECEPQDISRVLDKHRVGPYASEAEVLLFKPGDKIPSERLKFKDMVICVNYRPKESVFFLAEDGKSFRYAVIVQADKCNEIMSPNITIATNSGDKNETSVKVCPLQVSKILTNDQRAALSASRTSSQFTKQLILHDIPCSNIQDLSSWLHDIYTSEHVQNLSSCVVSMINVRLIAHMHCLLVCKGYAPSLFLPAVLKLQDIVCEADIKSCKSFRSDVITLREKLSTLNLECSSDFEHHSNHSIAESYDGDDGDDDDSDTSEVGQLPHLSQQQAQLPQPSQQSSPSSNLSVMYPLSRFQQTRTRRGYRTSHTTPSRFLTVHEQQRQVPPQPPVSLEKAKAWIDQAKSDYLAATEIFSHLVQPESHISNNADETAESDSDASDLSLSIDGHQSEAEGSDEEIISADEADSKSSCSAPESIADSIEQPNSESSEQQPEASPSCEERVEIIRSCRFPALVCSLCHESVEKFLKAILYALCGVQQQHLNCSHLVTLLQTLQSSDHSACCQSTINSFSDCVMQINEHENKSRYPNYQIPVCAPATVYTHIDAQEALSAVESLVQSLQECVHLREIAINLSELPRPRFMSTLKSMMGSAEDFPVFWQGHDEDEVCKLVLLDPDGDLHEQEEYDRIAYCFLQTMSNVEHLKIERIQNKLLWRKYLDCGKQMLSFNDGILGEHMLFHGTRTTRPEEIYRGDASFDVRFSREGLWGKGTYFAVNASYSHTFAFTAGNFKKMLVAWVLTGQSYYSTPHNFDKPPKRRDRSGGIHRRYNSVSGVTGGSKVFITYDNNQGYPAYLITYSISS